MSRQVDWRLDEGAVQAILTARHGDPFAVLGLHDTGAGLALRAFVADATSVNVLDSAGVMLAQLECRDGAGLFEGLVPEQARRAYRLHAQYANGAHWTFDDPYRFAPILGEMDDYLVKEGTHRALYERLGAHEMVHQGVAGVHFALWAPAAQRVSVMGDFNGWDARRHMMRKRIDSGCWEIFIPALTAGAVYKYELIGAGGMCCP